MTLKSYEGKIIPCPICKGDNHTLVSERDRYGAALRTALCRTCGHVFTNPQPTEQELKAFYGKHYRADYKGTITPKKKHVYRAGLRALERFNHLSDYCQPKSRILDVGSGGGEFVYLLQKVGFDAHGIEPNLGYAQYSQQTYNTNIMIGSAEEVLNREQSWDFITLHHVLEHLADPLATLKLIGHRLAPGGKLFIEVPNIEARYHGPGRRFHLAHLQSFSIDSLILAGNSAGFSTLDLVLRPHTGHISAVLEKNGDGKAQEPQATAAERIEKTLRSDTPLRDLVTPRPYRRLWANLKRPVQEWLALRKLGRPSSGKELLDRLYAPELARNEN